MNSISDEIRLFFANCSRRISQTLKRQETFLLQLKDLPEVAQDMVAQKTKPHTVVIIINDEQIGSGTLVKIGNVHGILTVEHVVRHPDRPDLRLDNAATNGPRLLLPPADFPGGIPIESFALRVFTTQRCDDSHGPDLAFVALPPADVKGDAYEGLLQKNAEDVKGGAGQYFTPRPLTSAMVEVMVPRPGQTMCDPAGGTGGFVLATHDYLASHYSLDRAQKKSLKSGTLFVVELVDAVARLCCMNLLLHGIGGDGTDEVPIQVRDALAGKHGEYDLVLTNPPFGKKSSVTIVNDAGDTSKESLIINRDDFWASTSNKQLNFLQHVFTILKQHGRAAVVVPDNVLFEGGAGETVRRELLKQADVHTLLRLPTGIFYAQGVKANVLFFDRKPAQEKPWTQKLWIYDLRTNLHFTLKESTLKRTDLDDFVVCYNPKNRHDRKESVRFKGFAYDDLVKRDKVNLDIFWLKDDALEESANLPAPEIIAQEITDDLEAALEQFATIADDLKK